jgi:hypothetical protein
VTASAYAQEIGAMYLETSAKDDLNVHDIFVQLSTDLLSSFLLSPSPHINRSTSPSSTGG